MNRMMRLSPEQYDAMLERQKKHAQISDRANLSQLLQMTEELTRTKPTKYRSRACGGYQSVKEARRASELKLKEKAGYIRNLREQVTYELIPAQRDNEGRVLERSCRFVADFVYEQGPDWWQVVEDVKGYKKGAAYALFTIKRKLMLQVHGIRIREI